MAYFCEKSGVRIVAPGVSKTVDPDNGHDEFSEPAAPVAIAEPSKAVDPDATPAPSASTESKPAKSGK